MSFMQDPRVATQVLLVVLSQHPAVPLATPQGAPPQGTVAATQVPDEHSKPAAQNPVLSAVQTVAHAVPEVAQAKWFGHAAGRRNPQVPADGLVQTP